MNRNPSDMPGNKVLLNSATVTNSLPLRKFQMGNFKSGNTHSRISQSILCTIFSMTATAIKCLNYIKKIKRATAQFVIYVSQLSDTCVLTRNKVKVIKLGMNQQKPSKAILMQSQHTRELISA